MGTKVITDAAVCRVVAQAIPAHVGRVAITPAMSLRNDLAIDSIGLIGMVFLLEENLGLDLYKASNEFMSAELVSDVIGIVKACAGGGA